MERVRDLRGEHPVGANHRRHVRRLDGDLEVAEVEPLEQLHLLDRRRDQSLCLVCLRELLEVLRRDPELAPIRIGIPAFFAAATTSSTLSGPADVAGVDPHGGDAGLDRLQGEAGVEVDVRDHGDGAQAHDPGERVGVLDLRDGAANDLTAGRHERSDLSGRRLDVVRRRQRHRLDHNGRAAADRDIADADLNVGSHAKQGTRPLRRNERCQGQSLATDVVATTWVVRDSP
jgi:hypothetical protein